MALCFCAILFFLCLNWIKTPQFCCGVFVCAIVFSYPLSKFCFVFKRSAEIGKG